MADGNISQITLPNNKTYNLKDTSALKTDGSNQMTGDLGIIFGNTDKFIHFIYNTDSLINNSWRVGIQGSKSGDKNYFIIQSGGVNNSTNGEWRDALRIGQQTYNISILGDLYPIKDDNNNNTITQSLGSSSLPWAHVYATDYIGEWKGTEIGVTYGGTGTTATPTQGGIIYASSTSSYASTSAGSTGQVLKSNGANTPTWENEYQVEIIDISG